MDTPWQVVLFALLGTSADMLEEHRADLLTDNPPDPYPALYDSLTLTLRAVAGNIPIPLPPPAP